MVYRRGSALNLRAYVCISGKTSVGWNNGCRSGSGHKKKRKAYTSDTMSVIKKKLGQVLNDVKAPAALKINYEEQQELRWMIKKRMHGDLAELFKRAYFDDKHGLVYKLLKTDKKRLCNSNLCAHDTMKWLRDFGNATAATWVLKLAGPRVGQVSRNQVLKWLHDENRKEEMRLIYTKTKKWGFKDSDHTKNIVFIPEGPESARKLYKDSKFETKAARKIFGNRLLQHLINQKCTPNEIFAFFKMLPKDLFSFQIMLSGMIRYTELREFRDEVCQSLDKEIESNNIKMDDVLQNTSERLKRLPLSPPKASISKTLPLKPSHILRQSTH